MSVMQGALKQLCLLTPWSLTRFQLPTIVNTRSYHGVHGSLLNVKGLNKGHGKYDKRKIKVKQTKHIPGAVRYRGFNYFPRFPDEKDPPYEPSKLFSVRLIKSLVGQPYWEKHICNMQLKLEKIGNVNVVKNTPTMNALLYKVKHLVELKPITFPHGFPEDPKHGYLDEYGRFFTYKLLPTDLEQATKDKQELTTKSLDGMTLKDRLRLKWYSRWN